MTTIFAFIGAVALLVLFHEFGHYWVARRCGVKVLRFSIGFGRVIYSKRFAGNSTEWVVSAIPLGGYVKMVDEREGVVLPEDLPFAFNRKPVMQRMAIVAAGPFANFLLAIVLYWALFIHGMPGLKPVLGDVPPGSPAALAELQPREEITSVDGVLVSSWQDLRWRLLELSLRQDMVVIEGRSILGQQLIHHLDLGSLKASDLDGEFFEILGLHLYQPEVLPIIGKLSEGGVAQVSGLQEGDVILSADGSPMQSWMEVVKLIRAHPAIAVQFVIQRGDLKLNISITPDAVVESGETVGKIGAAPKINKAEWQAMFIEVSYPPAEALMQSLRKTWETSIISLKMLGKMIIGEVSMKNLSGPITIADYAGQSAAMGLVAYFGFLALISISLGVLNLLPIPILDGGHLLYYVAELIKGSPVSERAWEVGQNIGIALLGMLMVFAIYNDINRLVSG